MMLTAQIALILAVSIAAFVISLLLDRLFTPLPILLQFLLQVPILVLLIEKLRQIATNYSAQYSLTETDIHAAFFFTAPLSAMAALTLSNRICRLLK